MKPWTAWSDEAIKRRQPDALAEHCARQVDKLEYHRNSIYLMNNGMLLKYANDHFIQIIGDMPLMAADSGKWATPHWLQNR